MKAIATEIIVAQRSADIQSLQSQIKTQNDYPVSGKSFAEYLASVKSSEPEKRPVESASMKKAETKSSSESKAEKPADTIDKASDKVPTDETIEKVDESQSSSKEVKKEDAKDGDFVAVEEKKNLKKGEKPETAEEKLSYLRLDLIKEENVEVKDAAQSFEKDSSEIKIMPSEISGKVASADDENGIELLKNANAADGIDFEVGDVSAEALALESVQGDSTKDTELGLARVEVQLGEIAADSRLDKINVEKSSISAESLQDNAKSEKSKSKLTVTDLRTQKTDKEIDVAKLDDAEPKLKVTTVIEGSDTATITMDLNQPQQNVADNVLSLNNQAAGADGSNFQAMLNNQIQENATEFVKASNVILKDNGKGTINLVLHPDDLGDVRFHLSLDGNKITGHITVNTKEALEVFKDNAQTLREAFIKSGFENAGFEVSYNSNGTGGNGEFEQNRQSQNNFFAKRKYDALNEVVAEQIMVSDDNFGEFNINIVA